MNRLYVVESALTHHRRVGGPPLADASSQVESFARAWLSDSLEIGQGKGQHTRFPMTGSMGWSKTCGDIAAAAWSSPGTGSRPSSTPWPMPSTPAWATSGRRSFYTQPIEVRPLRCRRQTEPNRLLSAVAADELAERDGRPADVDALHHPRRQPGLQRPGRLALRRTHGPRALPGPPGPVRGRNVRPVPLAHSRGALPRILGRCPRLRRHRPSSSR